VLADLDPDQRRVAQALLGPVCVLAGAGTGKTRAITHRIAYGVRTGTYDPQHLLAVTFTTRAAAEMRTRLARLGVRGVTARTFHSAALAQVRHLWPRLYGTPFPPVLDDPSGLLRDLAGAGGVGASDHDLAAEIGWAKASNVAPDQYVERAAGRRVSGATPEQVAGLYLAYTDALQRAERVDLDDVLLATVGVLQTQPRAADLVRRRYRRFVVDEFQDVSGLQRALLDCWLGEREEICVVGDPAQSVYAFAGAQPRYLTEFTTQHPSAQVLELTRNYRSTPQVLAVAAAVRPPTSGSPALQPTRPPGAPVLLAEADDDRAEAAGLVAAVRAELAAGTRPGDVAVLVRTRSQVGEVGRALRAGGVAVSARGATRFFERPEVRQVVALLAAAARRDTAPSQPGDGQPDPAGLGERTEAVLVEAGWTPQRPTAAGDLGRWESWASVLELARSLQQTAADSGDPPPRLGDLVDDLRERARSGEEPRAVGVTVATLHATKGQEWPVVFVVGVHDGALPSAAATTRTAGPDALAEEQRLLYVGLTRARDRLTVSWSARRTPQQASRRRPSRFLQPLIDAGDPAANIRLRPHGADR
jgi:DNA helicase-2/ATP-dependent DNA helicase PcrA